jgi:hypothetical protein
MIQNVPASDTLLPPPNTPFGLRPSQPLALASIDTTPLETDQKYAKRPRVADGSAETSLPPILSVLQSGTGLGAVEAPLPPLPDTSSAPPVRPS